MSEQRDRTKLYRTSDLYFAAFLCSIDIQLKYTEKDRTESGTKVIFVFELQDSVLIRAKALYFGGSGTVPARKFVDNMRSLKSLCYT